MSGLIRLSGTFEKRPLLHQTDACLRACPSRLDGRQARRQVRLIVRDLRHDLARKRSFFKGLDIPGRILLQC
ncbi:MAG: hypothetical protein DRH37_00345 [Deltaproteobacteria bacterium]|nr:MAG: hypothetical protein DRH37_00345 [Deltaproteobacteria bacterium]